MNQHEYYLALQTTTHPQPLSSLLIQTHSPALHGVVWQS